MPGIAGVLADKPISPALLQAMLQSMMHEPFYSSASYVNVERGWYAGSVGICNPAAKLSPILNETGTVALLLAGECLDDPASKALLRSHGHDFNPEDASFVVHLYEEEGPTFVKRLKGLFSGVVLDGNTGQALLFTDRYGLRKLYFHHSADGFFFASEAKAVLKVLPVLKSADAQSIAEYLCFDCVLNDRSFFHGINCLPGEAVWIHKDGRLDKISYYDPSPVPTEDALQPRLFLDQLEATFRQALLRLIKGDKLSIALTGGLDTRLIMACLPRNSSNVATFTFGGMYRDSVDVRLAKEVSRECHLVHETVRLDEDFLSNYPSHAARAVYVTDGLADATIADNLYLNQCARQIAPVKITGAFGSQVLGRVRRALRYQPPTPGLISEDFTPQILNARDALTAWCDEPDLSHCIRREIPWYWSRFIVSELSQLTLRLPFLDNDFVDLLFRAPPGGFDGSEFEIAAIRKNRPELLRIRTSKGVGGAGPAALSGIIETLFKARTLTEKVFDCDVPPRSLHHGVVRFDSLLLSPLHLDHWVRGWEHFSHYNLWYRRQLAPFLKAILLDEKTLRRPYWNARNLEETVLDHISGRRNNLAAIRKVLTIELILREVLQQ